MKKLVIFVASLVVAVGGLGTLVVNNALANEDGAEAREDVLHLTPNEYSFPKGTKIDTVSVERNSINISIPLSPEASWRAMRIIFAQQDYEAGYTRAEAETELAKLGVAETKSLAIMHDQDTRDSTPLAFGIRMNIGNVGENKSDRIYYAIQYADFSTVNGEQKWENAWWERGIIDYRDCVHTKVFEENTLCLATHSGKNEYYKLEAADGGTWSVLQRPAGEAIVTWDEEWRELQQGRINNVRTELGELNEETEGLLETLARLEAELDRIETGVDKVAGTESMQTEIQELREQIKALRAAVTEVKPDDKKEPTTGEEKEPTTGGDKDSVTDGDNKTPGGGNEDKNEDKDENGKDEGTGAGNGTKPGVETGSNGTGNSEISEPGENGAGTTEVEERPGKTEENKGKNDADGLKTGNLVARSAAEALEGQGKNVVLGDGGQGEKSGKTADKAQKAENGVKNAAENEAGGAENGVKNEAETETPEVPKSGKAGAKRWLWWAVIAGAGLGVMGLVLIKRRKRP